LRLVVGLGNPGPKYAFTRHNMGWLVVDRIVDEENCGTPDMRYKGLLWGPLMLWGKEEKTLFLKPLTYMNLSGLAVRDVLCRFSISPQDVLVVFDDMALPFGAVRLRGKGSSGGHKGMQSIINSIGSQIVPRLRVGIGHPHGPDTIDHVISPFDRSEMKLLPDILTKAVASVRCWFEEDLQSAMNYVNAPDKTVENKDRIMRNQKME